MTKVSILMNAYNSEEYLKEAIDSVYAQTFKNWEIIFIDNCSTDNTKNIIDTYNNKIKYYRTKKNMPLGAARNFGLKYCNGTYIAFLDTDDIWLKNKLDMQVKIMDENKEYQLCYGGVVYINRYGKEIKKMLPKAQSGDVFVQQLIRYEINMLSSLLRNNINIKINEEQQFSPDFDLFMNIAKNFRVYVINDYLVKYRKLENSLTSKNIDVWWSETKYTLDKIFLKDDSFKYKYPHEYRLAYAKVSYYKAEYLMSIGSKSKASKELSKYKFINFTYFILYIATLFPNGIWNAIHRHK